MLDQAHSIFGGHWSFFIYSNAKVTIVLIRSIKVLLIYPLVHTLQLIVRFTRNQVPVSVSPCMLSLISIIEKSILWLSLRWVLRQFIYTLWKAIIVFLYKSCVLHLHLQLIPHKVALVSVLRLNSPCHLKIPSLVAHIGTSLELIGKSLVIHAFFDSINYRYDIINIFFEFFTFLKTCHWNQFRFLICYCIKISTLVVATRRVRPLLGLSTRFILLMFWRSRVTILLWWRGFLAMHLSFHPDCPSFTWWFIFLSFWPWIFLLFNLSSAFHSIWVFEIIKFLLYFFIVLLYLLL